MTPFVALTSVAIPMPLANVDTDKILPARFLKTIRREGLGDALFADARAGGNHLLDRAPWSSAQILVALENFGCGSSREHAPWALLDFGIRCIIAPSFADIFYNNCTKNGILPVVLSHNVITSFIALADKVDAGEFQVDLVDQAVTPPAGRSQCFTIDAVSKHRLLNGIDDIATTLGFTSAISSFEKRRVAMGHVVPSIPGDIDRIAHDFC